MQTVEFHPLVDDASWNIATQLCNAFFPEDPVSVEQMKLWADELPKDTFVIRRIAYANGEPIAYYRTVEPFWTQNKGSVDIRVSMPYNPNHAGLFGKIIDNALDEVRDKGFDRVTSWTRSDHEQYVDTALALGFVERQRNPMCTVDPRTVDYSQFDWAIQKAADNGYEIISLPEFEALKPESWQREYWRWEQDVMHDVPLPEPYKDIELDQYIKMLMDPTVRREGYFLAVKDGQVAASTQLHWNAVDPTLASTGLTGTAESHRRYGLATALKVRAMHWAVENGITKIIADNEEDNPMRKINFALGFVPSFSHVSIVKSLS